MMSTPRMTTLIKSAIESLRFFLRQCYVRLHRSSRDEAVTAIEKLDYEREHVVRRSEQLALVQFLRSRLQRTPYWRKGHVALGHAALALGDIATAYASGHALRALDQGTMRSKEGDELLGLSYLKRGAHERALALLEPLYGQQPENWRLAEDVAACYLGLGNYEKAQEFLSRVPENRRSMPGAAALQFAAKKQSEGGKGDL